MAASIAELGIRLAKGQSGLGKTLWILSFLEGSICLKYFRSAIIHGPLIPEVHMHDKFQKIIFENAWLLWKLNPSKISCYAVSIDAILTAAHAFDYLCAKWMLL